MAIHTSVTPQQVAATRLILSVCTISLIWLVVLPWLSRRPAIETHLRDLNAKGIDPSAMYYTDLKVMDRILDRLEGREGKASSN